MLLPAVRREFISMEEETNAAATSTAGRSCNQCDAPIESGAYCDTCREEAKQRKNTPFRVSTFDRVCAYILGGCVWVVFVYVGYQAYRVIIGLIGSTP